MAYDKLVDSSQLNSDLGDVADAIRAKSGGSSQLAFPSGFISEIGSISTGGGGGAEITSGIVITELDTSFRIKKADVYLDDTVPYGFANTYYSTAIVAGSFTCYGKPRVIREYAFQNFGDCSTIDCSEITTLWQSSFRGAKYVGAKQFPKCATLASNGYQFWECSSVTALSFPLITSCPSNAFGRCTSLVSCEIGSVGVGVTSINNGAFNGSTQTGLTITIYTTGSYTDTAVANTRNGATKATIIIKASEATTYNGTSYAAGDTILTSEVTS